MKILPLIVAIFLSLPVFANDECPMIGVFISDASKSLADYSIKNTVSSSEEHDALTKLFEGGKHEWRCDEVRAWHDGYLAIDWTRTTMSKISPNTQLLSFPNTNEPDFYFVFEGPCYKIRTTDRNYFEYYCPLDTE